MNRKISIHKTTNYPYLIIHKKVVEIFLRLRTISDSFFILQRIQYKHDDLSRYNFFRKLINELHNFVWNRTSTKRTDEEL